MTGNGHQPIRVVLVVFRFEKREKASIALCQTSMRRVETVMARSLHLAGGLDNTVAI